MDLDLSQIPTTELLEAAREKRQLTFGQVITYSPKAFFPLTMLCRDRCGYCTFAKAPTRLPSPYMTMEQIAALAGNAVLAGCKEALFTLGERPEERYKSARAFLTSNGFGSTIEYLAAAAEFVLQNFGLLPHPNAGALYSEELFLLRGVSVSQGMMLESIRPDLPAHKRAPDKTPERRLSTLREAGKARIPFTTGILVGIGESEADRIAALEAIAAIHRSYGHIQEVIVQNFLPKPGTTMHRDAPPTSSEYQRAIALARLILPSDVSVQAPPNLSDSPASLLSAGVDDLGGISPLTIDHVNPERPWPHLEELRHDLAREGFDLTPRTAVHPSFALRSEYFDPKVYPTLLSHIDSEGYAREDAWVSGGATSEKIEILSPRHRPDCDRDLEEIFTGVERCQLAGEEEILRLFNARGNRVLKVLEFADHLRKTTVGEAVTFVSNRNINYTNICTFKCRFCAFSKGPMSLNLRGTPYLLSLEDIAGKVLEAEAVGATEVCLQGGIHPSFDGNFYLEVVRAVRAVSPQMHVHAFSALEISEGSSRLGMDLREYLIMMKEAGLKTLPGTAAEILDDQVRAVLCPDKISSSRWLEVHETAHEVGLRSNVTIMFGSMENPRSWAKHICVTRAVQLRTQGFTEFVPLPFVHMASPIYLSGKARRGPTLRESLLMHAVGRIAYHGSIENIQASWVKMGTLGAQALLRAGANDLGGTLIEENISHAAGSEHGRSLGISELLGIANAVGRPLHQRNTLYEIISEKPEAPPTQAPRTTALSIGLRHG